LEKLGNSVPAKKWSLWFLLNHRIAVIVARSFFLPRTCQTVGLWPAHWLGLCVPIVLYSTFIHVLVVYCLFWVSQQCFEWLGVL